MFLVILSFNARISIHTFGSVMGRTVESVMRSHSLLSYSNLCLPKMRMPILLFSNMFINFLWSSFYMRWTFSKSVTSSWHVQSSFVSSFIVFIFISSFGYKHDRMPCKSSFLLVCARFSCESLLLIFIIWLISSVMLAFWSVRLYDLCLDP